MPLGDSAFLIRLRINFAADPEAALAHVLSVVEAVRAANITGISDVVPAFDSVGVFVDPREVAQAGRKEESIFARLQKILNTGNRAEPMPPVSGETVEIPVCYCDEFAVDLSRVAQQASLLPDEVIERHSTAVYRVHCLGFTPGFPFLGGMPAELATPRHVEPRIRVPAGAVAIGGRQTGIYPIASPGGWNIIGRTPLQLFDASRDRPTFLRLGDRVRFRPITEAEFHSHLR